MSLRLFAKSLLYSRANPLRRYCMPGYRYNVPPGVLLELCRAIEETRRLEGPIVEVGCAAGATTVFLNRYLAELKLVRRYVCIDTFAGFTSLDIEYERSVRHKQDHGFLNTAFSTNSRALFEQTMLVNRILNVSVIEGDIGEVDLTPTSQAVVCFIDVDLYKPVLTALKALLPRMAVGGVVLVDDCFEEQEFFDGSLQAYREFTLAHGFPEDIVRGRLGRIVKSERSEPI